MKNIFLGFNFRSRASSVVSFIALLLYSFMPAAAKLLESRYVFLLGYIFALIFIYSANGFKFRINANHLAIFGVIFILYSLLITAILSCLNLTNDGVIYIGIAMYVIPLGLSLISNYKVMADMIFFMPWVGLIHALIAIIIYPLFPMHIFLGDFSNVLQDGVMAFRMSSVSGSLAFSSLMAISFVITIFKVHASRLSKYMFSLMAILFLICTLLSLQRSMWIVTIFFTSYALIRGYISWMYLLKILLVGVMVLFLIGVSIGPVFDIFIDLLVGKVQSIGISDDSSAVSERLDQWLGVFNNIYELPFGSGIGQIGQSSRDQFLRGSAIGIPDGDFFRIISEYGPLGAIFVFLVLYKFICCFISLLINDNPMDRVMLYSVYCILVFQCVGSNMTEFYFINFIFFVIFINLDVDRWQRMKLRS